MKVLYACRSDADGEWYCYAEAVCYEVIVCRGRFACSRQEIEPKSAHESMFVMNLLEL